MQTLPADEFAESASQTGRERVLEADPIAFLALGVDDGELDSSGQRTFLSDDWKAANNDRGN